MGEEYAEGVIDELRSVKGVELAMTVREPPDAARRCRGGSRCGRRRDALDVSAIARQRGGGGHKRAAGFSSDESIEEIIEFVRSRVRRCRRARLSRGALILVDKPAGPSSFQVIAAIRRRTGARTGHAGTLDPFATGLLLVLSGAATRLAPWLVGLDKRYLTEVDLTARTSTGDPEGEVVEELRGAGRGELEQRLAGLRGEVELPIPAASAVKIGGERAYRLHRRGQAVEMPVRRSQVSIARAARLRRRRRPPRPAGRLAARTSARSPTRSAGTAATLRRTRGRPVLGRRRRRRADRPAGGGAAVPARGRGRLRRRRRRSERAGAARSRTSARSAAASSSPSAGW